jgi:hypothetical protein
LALLPFCWIEALSNAGKELLHLTNRLEDSGQMISDQLRQMDAMYLTKPSEVTPVKLGRLERVAVKIC